MSWGWAGEHHDYDWVRTEYQQPFLSVNIQWRPWSICTKSLRNVVAHAAASDAMIFTLLQSLNQVLFNFIHPVLFNFIHPVLFNFIHPVLSLFSFCDVSWKLPQIECSYLELVTGALASYWCCLGLNHWKLVGCLNYCNLWYNPCSSC